MHDAEHACSACMPKSGCSKTLHDAELRSRPKDRWLLRMMNISSQAQKSNAVQAELPIAMLWALIVFCSSQQMRARELDESTVGVVPILCVSSGFGQQGGLCMTDCSGHILEKEFVPCSVPAACPSRVSL